MGAYQHQPHSFGVETTASALPRVLEEVGQEPADNYTSSRQQPFSPLLSTRVISTAASPYKCLVCRGATTMLTKRLHSTLFIPMAPRSPLIEWVLTIS